MDLPSTLLCTTNILLVASVLTYTCASCGHLLSPMPQYSARVTIYYPRTCPPQREQHTIAQKPCPTRRGNGAPCASHEERSTHQGTESALIDIPRIMPINSLKSIVPSPFMSNTRKAVQQTSPM